MVKTKIKIISWIDFIWVAVIVKKKKEKRTRSRKINLCNSFQKQFLDKFAAKLKSVIKNPKFV